MSATIIPFHKPIFAPFEAEAFSCTCKVSPEEDKRKQKRTYTPYGWVCSVCHKILTKEEVENAKSKK